MPPAKNATASADDTAKGAKNVTKNANAKSNAKGVKNVAKNANANAAKKRNATSPANAAAPAASKNAVLGAFTPPPPPRNAAKNGNANAAAAARQRKANAAARAQMTPSQKAADPVFQCKMKVRNDILHGECVKNKNCDAVTKCGKQKVGDKEYDTVGSADWPLGNPDKWPDVKERFLGPNASPERKRAFRETNQCIRRVLYENYGEKYDACNKLGESPQKPAQTKANANTGAAKPSPTAAAAAAGKANAKQGAQAGGSGSGSGSSSAKRRPVRRAKAGTRRIRRA